MFTINTLINVGLFNASFFLLYFIRTRKKEKKIQDLTASMSYENKYKEKYNMLEEIDIDKEDLEQFKNKIIIENTPRGNILLYFNFETEVFDYYCDKKDIPYLYLETVARKYVTQYNCKQIFVNMADELKKDSQENIKQNVSGNTRQSIKQYVPDNKQISQIVQKTPFAEYKKYNKNISRGNKNDTKKYILKENSNRYSYCGKISEYSFLKDQYYKNTKMTFADFKNKINNKT